ncbi:MAG: 2-succinyl-5-enolpyruvyl-6-hydroxy-3-cyclohexene-1-carboxylic-acid synthase [Corynebacteriales bacterium]|nr:2-succinyl-5-enolpyruvyl-6-hydroxy-3-cyclohexene-1-carboxylic-acid synthase [Mycobacteriales bacterium]
MNETSQNPATVQAETIVDELVRCGVVEAVLSPGSWSTPLALAFARRKDIRLHVRIDERSAAFVALGLTKISGRPVPVVCTSGSAVANFHPAVMEADAAHLPLVVLTADRPPEMRYTGSSQTTDQIKIFGTSVRMFAELGVAEARAGSNAYWRSLIARLIGTALDSSHGGPVHVNVCFRKPFFELSPGNDWPESTVGRVDGAPWVKIASHSSPAVDIAAPAKGLLVLGEGAPDPVAALLFAEHAGWPVIAEPNSAGGSHWNGRTGAHALSAGGALASVPEFRASHQPDMVITVGKPTLNPALTAWCATAPAHVVVDPRGQWADPGRGASKVIPALGMPLEARPDGQWLESWLRCDRAARAAIDDAVNGDVLNEPLLARELLEAMPTDSLLFVGSSMPIRDVNLMMRPRSGVRICTNRGVSGIDGVVSSAVGAALAHQRAGGGQAYALLGDLTLLHDHNGLLIGPDEPRPDLTFIVPNNDGGAIFSTLPVSQVDAFERVWGTPHRVDLAHMAAALSVPYQQLGSVAELKELISSGESGIRLAEVRTHRATNAELHEKLATVARRAVLSVLH